MGIHAWSKLLSKEGVPISFKGTEIDARYPRTAWLQLLLERGTTIESLIDYFFCMAHRHQLAFLEDSPHLWETETHGTSSTDAWETYKANHIGRFVRYYTRNWKTPAETHRKRIETTRAGMAASKARVQAKAEASKNSKQEADYKRWMSEFAKMDLQSLENLVDQLEQIVETLEHQHSQKTVEHVKQLSEYAKEALERAKDQKRSSNKSNRNMKKRSRYPPL